MGRVEGHFSKSLRSVKMEHLMEVPLDQSGIAKAYDRDSANNFIYTGAG